MSESYYNNDDPLLLQRSKGGTANSTAAIDQHQNQNSLQNYQNLKKIDGKIIQDEGHELQEQSQQQHPPQNQQPFYNYNDNYYHNNYDEEDEDGSERSKQEIVQVVVEINNHHHHSSSRLHSSEEIDDTSISKSLDESISIIPINNDNEETTLFKHNNHSNLNNINNPNNKKKTKIIAKVKPNPRRNTTTTCSVHSSSNPTISSSINNNNNNSKITTTATASDKRPSSANILPSTSTSPTVVSSPAKVKSTSATVLTTNNPPSPESEQQLQQSLLEQPKKRKKSSSSSNKSLNININRPSSNSSTILSSPTSPLGSTNLGTNSPIFESGVNTECIQLLKQLWNVHEQLVDFHQQLLLILTKIQSNVQFTLDLDRIDCNNASSLSGIRKFKTSAFIASISSASSSRSTSPYHQQQRQEINSTKDRQNHEHNNIPSEAGPSTSSDHIVDNELLRQFLEIPPVDNFIQGLKSVTEAVNEIEKQYNLISICQSQCKLVLYSKVRHAKKYVIHDRFSVLYTVHRLILTMIQLLSSTTFWELNYPDYINSHLLHIFQLTEVYNSCLESTYESSIYTFNLNTNSQQQILVDKFQQNYATNNNNNNRIPLPDSSDGKSPTTIQSGNSASSSSAIQSTSQQQESNPTPSPSAPNIIGSNVEKNKISILTQILDAGKNDSPSCRLSLKPISATKLLQLFAQKRASFASYKFLYTIQKSFTLLGSGVHRLNVNKLAEEVVVLSLDKFESCFYDEDVKLNPFAKVFSKCPSLLGRGAVKQQFENGQERRLSASVKNKMYNYFRQILWILVGEIVEDLILWDYSIGIPLVSYSLDIFSLFKNSLMIGKKIGENNPTPILPTIDTIINSLTSFILLLSWDKKIQAGFELTFKIKRPEQISLLRNPKDGEWATGIGSKFGDIITTCLVLMEGSDDNNMDSRFKNNTSRKSSREIQPTPGCSSSSNNTDNITMMMKSKGKTSRQTSDEEPLLCDEAQILFRIDATLAYYQSWVVKRCKAWLNSWSMPAFLATSQRDTTLLVQLIKSHQTMFITRQILLSSSDVSIRLSANHRRMCAEDLQDTLTKFQKMPEELLISSGPICRTLALATIQSYMPNPAHWRGVGPNSGLNPDKPSPYVRTVITKVIEPVTIASVEFVSSAVQEGIGKQVIQATCEAWLQYILQKKIKFSEWGALQLLRDFMTLRDWIRNESLLDEEARKALLQLEILKRCEGVAFLLLRNYGDVLGVGKPSRSTRRVAPTTRTTSTQESNQSSPSSVSDNSVAEDDIPPEMYVPNQQIWLNLRVRKNLLSPCCQ